MAGGAGFIIDMNNKIKENQALRKKRKNFFEKDHYYLKKAKDHQVDLQTASPEELDAFHQKLKKSHQKDQFNAYLIFVLSIFVTILLIIGLVYVFNYLVNK